MAKKIIDIFSTVLLICLVALVLLLHGGRLFGIKTYSVLSGSMEPEIHTGSAVYVKGTAPENIRKGDVITFNNSGTVPVTHRVIDIDGENRKFFTKGDANKTADGATGFDNLIGKVVFTVPYLGFVAVWISTVTGKVVIVGFFMLALILVFVSEMFLKKQHQ